MSAPFYEKARMRRKDGLVSCPGHFLYPHTYAWRLRVDTEPPCVSMRVDASISANRIAGTAYYQLPQPIVVSHANPDRYGATNRSTPPKMMKNNGGASFSLQRRLQ